MFLILASKLTLFQLSEIWSHMIAVLGLLRIQVELLCGVKNQFDPLGTGRMMGIEFKWKRRIKHAQAYNEESAQIIWRCKLAMVRIISHAIFHKRNLNFYLSWILDFHKFNLSHLSFNQLLAVGEPTNSIDLVFIIIPFNFPLHSQESFLFLKKKRWITCGPWTTLF